MYGRSGLDRFKKAQSSEPFSVTANSSSNNVHPPVQVQTSLVPQYQSNVSQIHSGMEAAPSGGPSQQLTQVGGGQSTWQPPDWAIEPRQGVYYLDVLKDGEVLDRILLDKRRHIFGRQFHTCDIVLDHQSVSRQHAAVIPHKNGSIYVIDLGSAHGTFVANERLTKDSPVELEVGQSLKFAASTRTYILRKNNAALFPRRPSLSEIKLPAVPDPSDEEAVLAYNTLLNRYGLSKPDTLSDTNKSGCSAGGKDDIGQSERPTKRIRKTKVAFRDQVGGLLVEVVGYSDGVDVETEPGPMDVKEGSLVGKYESLVQVTLIPKGKEQFSFQEENTSQKGVTDKLLEVLNKVKNKTTVKDDLYGESFSGKVGSSWAYSSVNSGSQHETARVNTGGKDSGEKSGNVGIQVEEDDDDLFGD